MTRPEIIDALKRALVLVEAGSEALQLDNVRQARSNLAFALGIIEAALEDLERGGGK